jgi:hypothetical protein
MIGFPRVAAAVIRTWVHAEGAWTKTDGRTKFVGYRLLSGIAPVTTAVMDRRAPDKRAWLNLKRALQPFYPYGRMAFPPDMAVMLGLAPLVPLTRQPGDLSAAVDPEGNPALLIAAVGPVPLVDGSMLVGLGCSATPQTGKLAVYRVEPGTMAVERTYLDWTW